MGYDDGECVICRLELNGGNNSTKNRAIVCLLCIHHLSENSGAVDNRLVSVMKNHLDYGHTTCERCSGECTIWFNVSACSDHFHE